MADTPTLEQHLNEYVSEYPSWAARATTANVRTPSNERIAFGWAIEQPTHTYFNWHMNRTDRRLNKLEGTVDYINKYGTAGSTASVTSKPGAIPRAKDDGKLDASYVDFGSLAMGEVSPVIGACILNPSGGSEFIVVHVDAEGKQVNPDTQYFDNHPTYKALQRVVSEGQVMIRHKKFYYKTMTINSGELAGKTARMISPTQLEGFKVFPSFMKDKQEIDSWLCGAYSAVDLGGSPKKLGSVPGKIPFVNVNFPTMEQYCNNLNTGSVSGFGMWDWHQFTEIQNLFLIEHASFDAQAKCGYGRCSEGVWDGKNPLYNTVSAADVAQATYRGHVGLWGNVWEMVRGIDVTTAGKLRVWNTDGSRAMVDTGYTLPAYPGTYYCRPVTLKAGAGVGYDFNTMYIPETQANTGVTGAQVKTVPAPTVGSIMDGFWGRYGTAGNVCYTGGDWGHGAFCGLFALNFGNPASYANVTIGTRLARV